MFSQVYMPKTLEAFEDDKATIVQLLNELIDKDYIKLLLLGATCSGKTILLESIITKYSEVHQIKADNYVLRLNSLKEQGIQYYRTNLKCFCQNITDVKKIVVVDDLDLLSESYQHMLRSCINNYSNNVHFIMTCTNINRLQESFTALLLTIDIPNISLKLKTDIFDKVKSIENININDSEKTFIIDNCHNIKNMLNILQKIKLAGDGIRSNTFFCDINSTDFSRFTLAVKNKKLKEASTILLSFYSDGYSVIDILDNYFQYVKRTLEYTNEQKYNIIKIITKFNAIFHDLHDDHIELPLFVNNVISIL